jgi:ribonuclease BN (tRNA processing enzyme)
MRKAVKTRFANRWKRAVCGLAVLACGACGARQAAGASRASASARCKALQLEGAPLELVVLGSGGPRSAGRAASGYLVAIEGTPRFMVDAGPGVFARLGETGLPADHIDVLLLTHLHIDHVGDVPGLIKSRDLSSDAPAAYRLLGPRGGGPYPSTSEFVQRLFGPSGAYAYLPGFRNELRLTPEDLPIELDAHPRVVFEQAGIKVSSVAVDHGDVPAVAYRLERAGRSLVISGDLASNSSGITELARGADVLVYDAAVLDPPGSPAKLYTLHTAPKRIGEVAEAAHVRMLVLGHIPPAVEAHKQEVLASVRSSFSGRVTFAEDCMHVPVTAGPDSQGVTVPSESGAKE